MIKESGNIPVIFIKASCLPEAWEKTVMAVWEQGASLRTEYDRKDKAGNFLDPPSRDATTIIEVQNPFGEPRIHKNFPGGLEELEVYRQEVVDGIHDHWVDPSDPDKWTYTYHERIFRYKATTNVHDPNALSLPAINQIEYTTTKLAQTPHTRRAQAITWIPNADPQTNDPPCLQRLWFRLMMDEQGYYNLNMNSHWRSRDGWKGWFMNAFALTDLQRVVAEGTGKKLGEPVRLGRYVDICDSFHIYGSYHRDMAPELEKMRANPDFRTRSWNSDNPIVQVMFEETRAKLLKDPDYMKSK